MTAALICAALALVALCFVVYFAIDEYCEQRRARNSDLADKKKIENMIEPPDFLREPTK